MAGEEHPAPARKAPALHGGGARLPDWLVRNPLHAGWLWTGSWALLIVADELVDLAGWTWYVFVGMAALPTLGCTVAVLTQPRAVTSVRPRSPCSRTSLSGSWH